MRNLTLRFRSFFAAILSLVIFIPLSVITLEKAFNSSLSQSMLQQLRVQSLSLLSEFEFEENQASMPEILINDQFNIPDSGLYAMVLSGDTIVWKSLSTLNWQIPPTFAAPALGKESFIENFEWNGTYFLYAYTAEFESTKGFQPVSFYILQDKVIFDSEKNKFANTLWYWFSLVAVLLLVLLLVSLNAALLPINRLNKQIKLAENGQLKRIDQSYPPELEKLKKSINHLLNSEEQQRARYKNSLSDLAHSLKTPLAVLAGSQGLPNEAREPIHQIDQLIRRQLKRAVIGTSNAWEQAVLIQPVIHKLSNALLKVYADKNLVINTNHIHAEASFLGDMTDLMEILGNIMDNACKAAKQKISTACFVKTNWLEIIVEDDGPGIPMDKRQLLLHRGIRLDSYRDGQGIGMAVVTDLLSAYQGQLDISTSGLGGAKIIIKFPLN